MKQKYKVIMIFLFALMSMLFCLSLAITMITKNDKLLYWLVLPIGMLWIITIPCFFYAGFTWEEDEWLKGFYERTRQDEEQRKKELRNED